MEIAHVVAARTALVPVTGIDLVPATGVSTVDGGRHTGERAGTVDLGANLVVLWHIGATLVDGDPRAALGVNP